MASKYRRPLYVNKSASSWTTTSPVADSAEISKFHKRLPNFVPTKLISLNTIAAEIGVKAVYLKDESNRCGGRAFKILGASWAAFKAITSKTGLSTDADLDEVSKAAREAKIMLLAATAGNHGIAVANIARQFGISATIYVSNVMSEATRNSIRAEGAQVVVVKGSYEVAVVEAQAAAAQDQNILIQDTAFEGYEEIPQWVVDGYSTMMIEIDSQLDDQIADLIITPVGVGSLAQAVVAHSKSKEKPTRVLAVQSDASPVLWKCLQAGEMADHEGGATIMSGMNCSTLSTIAWPVLSAGLDACITVSDAESHDAVQRLKSLGVSAGPCGGAALAALRQVARDHSFGHGLTENSVVVILCTEGPREYELPFDISVEAPVPLLQSLVRIDSSNPGLSGGGGAGEGAISRFITAWLQHRDIETHSLEKIPSRPSVVGVVRGSGGGKSLMFNGHIDTVTNSSYDGDPLSGEIKDGRLYGRGSYDMKAGLAASLITLLRAKEAKLSGDVIFAGVADEENLSAGTEELLEAGWRADGAVISEPTNLTVVLAHKGFIWFEVDIIGAAAHGSRYDLGIDAICKAGHFLVRLDQFSHEILERPPHPLLGTGSIHASLIQGGEEPSSYPALCTITGEWRIIPGQTPNTVESDLRRILDELSTTVPDFKYTLRLGLSRPFFNIDKRNYFVSTALKNIEKELGREVAIVPNPIWTDCALLAEKGIPALLFGVEGAGAHARSEYATTASLHTVTEALSRIALDFCK